MSLVRVIARSMLASYFVVNGVRAARHPEDYAEDARSVTDRIVPAAKRVAPDEVAGFIPEDAATLVRVNGVLQAAGGLALATGKGRRLGAGLLALSLIPTTIARHPYWSREDPDERAADRAKFVKNVSLFGGVLLASQDTEGKPSLAWRANEGREELAKRTEKASNQARKALTSNRKNVAEAAVGSGLALVGGVVEESRKTRKQAAKQAKKAAGRAQKEAAETRKQAGRTAKKSAKKLSKQADRAKDSFEGTAKDVRKAARKTQRNVSDFAGDARSRLGEHIELGQN